MKTNIKNGKHTSRIYRYPLIVILKELLGIGTGT